MTELRTERLLLRPWRDEDVPHFVALRSDPVVMEHFAALDTREEAEARAGRLRGHMDRFGYGLWAVELPGEASFIGFVGLIQIPWERPFAPDHELGWTLGQRWWGRGYATEAARAASAYAFGPAGLDEVVAFTVPGNRRSRRVMETLGMTHDAEGDFDHPKVSEGHPLRRCVLYRLKRSLG